MNKRVDAISAMEVALLVEVIGANKISGLGISATVLGDELGNNLSAELRELLVATSMKVSELIVIKPE